MTNKTEVGRWAAAALTAPVVALSLLPQQASARTDSPAAAVRCTGDHVLDLAPGMSASGSSGVAHSPRAGRIECSDGRTGTLRYDGRYGIAAPATCTDGGDTWGVFTIRFKGQKEPVYDTLTGSYGGIAKGLVTGTFETELMTGRFVAIPTRGDCLTKPLSQARIKLTMTMR